MRHLKWVLAALVILSSPLSSAGFSQAESVHHAPGGFVTILGHNIWYESAGNGEPLLLIPGAGGSHDYFHPFFAPLERSFRVIYFDGFGRGNSDHAKSASEYTLEHDLDEIEALRQALHLGKIMVYGHSYGGFVAQGYALKYPDSVRKLSSRIFLSQGRISRRAMITLMSSSRPISQSCGRRSGNCALADCFRVRRKCSRRQSRIFSRLCSKCFTSPIRTT